MTITSTLTTATAAGPDVSGSVFRAQRRLAGQLAATPVLRCPELDELAGARLWLKAEHLQLGGSFKLRGALLAAERLARAGSRGLVAQSTGNHAIAVALAARRIGRPAVVVVPRDIVAGKAERILAAGAQVVLSGPTVGERAALASRVADELGYDVVDPYDDVDVLAGQGTASAELLDHMAAAGAEPAALVLPVGGGSALAGAALALRDRSHRNAGHGDVHLVGAEPAAVDSLGRALQAGRPVTVRGGVTVADGLRPDRVGDQAFEVLWAARRAGQPVRAEAASEAEIGRALCLAFLLAKQLVEPAAATALAVALRLASEREALRGKDIGVLLSGGNVDPTLLCDLLARHVVEPAAGAEVAS